MFFACPPGLEQPLLAEARALEFASPEAVAGGVTARGDWPEVWRANLWLRGATRVLVRIAEFRAMHLAQLDKRARKVPWAGALRSNVPVRVEATCKRSKIYHDKAATQRIATAITEELGAPITDDASLRVIARIEDDLVTISVDTSGEMLHKRGFKQAVSKAPLRETMASLLLRECGYTGDEPVLDPMCGSGTFLIEAAEIALGLAPGRGRNFAFEDLATIHRQQWARMKKRDPNQVDLQFAGYDRDAGAIRAAEANAERARVTAITRFTQQPISDLSRPEGPPGLVMVNPPYGARVGEGPKLGPLYRALGERLRAEFSSWRVGLITSEPGLARATGLPFGPQGPPLPHGALKIRLYRTRTL